jgi:hypothetical protein
MGAVMFDVKKGDSVMVEWPDGYRKGPYIVNYDGGTYVDLHDPKEIEEEPLIAIKAWVEVVPF